MHNLYFNGEKTKMENMKKWREQVNMFMCRWGTLLLCEISITS